MSCPAQRSCPSRDCLRSLLERSPDRPMAVRTAPNVKAAAEPQITPIKVPRATSPVHHSTPTLTSTDTTKNTTVDNIMVPASLVRILHPIVCVCLCDAPNPLRGRAITQIIALPRCSSSSLLLGEGLAQLVLLLLRQIRRDDLEVVLPELVDHPVGRGSPAGEREQRRGARR